MGMLPGAMQAKAAMSKAKIDEGQLKRQEAVILAMTPKERRNPDIIHASRKKRIAKGSGVAGAGRQQAAQAARRHAQDDETRQQTRREGIHAQPRRHDAAARLPALKLSKEKECLLFV